MDRNILCIYGAVGWTTDTKWIHSAGATLIQNGSVLATISEERLSRVKHDGNYPNLSINYCLELGNLSKEDIHIIGYVHNIFSGMEKDRIHNILQREFPNAKVKFVDHHIAHASACFYTSNFSEADILSLDGGGNYYPTKIGGGYVECGLFAKGDRNRGLHVIQHYKNNPEIMFDGLFDVGNMYNMFSRYIYERKMPEKAEKYMNENPHIFVETVTGKIMGLSGYGNYKNVKEEDIYYIEKSPYFPNIKTKQINFNNFNKYDPEDVASFMQHQLEKYIERFFLILYNREFLSNNLCIAGGVGFNVLVNRKLLDLNIYGNIHVFPATNDNGLCFGGALHLAFEDWKYNEISYELKRFHDRNLATDFSKRYNENEIEKALTHAKVEYEIF